MQHFKRNKQLFNIKFWFYWFYNQIDNLALVRTPFVEGNYSIAIYTFNTKKNAFIDYNTVKISINETYGLNEIMRVHSMNPPIRIKAGETGAIEVIFFLN